MTYITNMSGYWEGEVIVYNVTYTRNGEDVADTVLSDVFPKSRVVVYDEDMTEHEGFYTTFPSGIAPERYITNVFKDIMGRSFDAFALSIDVDEVLVNHITLTKPEFPRFLGSDLVDKRVVLLTNPQMSYALCRADSAEVVEDIIDWLISDGKIEDAEYWEDAMDNALEWASNHRS